MWGHVKWCADCQGFWVQGVKVAVVRSGLRRRDMRSKHPHCHNTVEIRFRQVFVVFPWSVGLCHLLDQNIELCLAGVVFLIVVSTKLCSPQRSQKHEGPTFGVEGPLESLEGYRLPTPALKSGSARPPVQRLLGPLGKKAVAPKSLPFNTPIAYLLTHGWGVLYKEAAEVASTMVPDSPCRGSRRYLKYISSQFFRESCRARY